MRQQFLPRDKSKVAKQRFLGFSARLLIFLSACTAHFCCSGAFQTPGRVYRRSISLNEAPLDSLTVKELRQLVKDSGCERGALSKLRKKQDLIEFLETGASSPYTRIEAQQDQPKFSTTESTRPPELSAPPNIPAALSRVRKAPLRMPPAPLEETQSLQEDVAVGPLSPKDVAFEQVFERYPPIRDAFYVNYSSPLSDVRQLYHPIFSTLGQTSDMDLIFVGTASCTPGITRGVSCTALRLNWRRRSSVLNPETNRMENVEGFQGGTWLFDAGECTQLQIQRTPHIRPSKITKIFVTHAHGDHSFGLPGLLCLVGQDRDRDSPPVDIYGPEGLRKWLRIAIRYSVSRIVPPYRVHEIMDIPMAPEWELAPRKRRYFYRGKPRDGEYRWGNKGLAGEDPTSWISLSNGIELEPDLAYGEIEGGRDIYPMYGHPLCADGAPVWEVEDEEDVRVYAGPMSHGIPCLGYVVDEQPRPGRLRNELVEPIVRRNVDALRKAGFTIPMKAMGVLKNLAPGKAFTFPDGTVVTQEQAVEPPRQGRKIVVCGDTCDSRALAGLAHDADVVVHEATNCFLPGIDRDTDLKSVTKDAIIHGHSTPQLAGRFAQQVNAKRLILNHFSARYKGDVSVDSLSIMMRIEKIAMKSSGLNETDVAAAWDLMALPIPSY